MIDPATSLDGETVEGYVAVEMAKFQIFYA